MQFNIMPMENKLTWGSAFDQCKNDFTHHLLQSRDFQFFLDFPEYCVQFYYNNKKKICPCIKYDTKIMRNTCLKIRVHSPIFVYLENKRLHDIRIVAEVKESR